MAKHEQWDWQTVRLLCSNDQIQNPSIAYVGHGSALNPPSIKYPWIKQNEHVTVKRLWHYPMQTINWFDIMKEVQASDVVLVAPEYTGNRIVAKHPFDNQHNAEFARRVTDCGLFEKPVSLVMGRLTPTELLVFMRQESRN